MEFNPHIIGSKYIYRDPCLHEGFQHITLDAWEDTSPHKAKRLPALAELKSQGKTIHGHCVVCKRSGYQARSLEELFSYVDSKLLDIEGVHSWDVLNEVVGYCKYLPDEWQLSVLERVRKLQPNSLLFWNEYALKNKRYWDEVMNLAEKAKKLGLLDGVGIQRNMLLHGKLMYSPVRKISYGVECHLKSWVSEQRLRHEIKRIHELDLLCHMSEVSVTCFHWQEPSAQKALQRLIDIAQRERLWRLTLWKNPVIKVVEAYG